MTIHSNVENKCKYCNTPYVPIPESAECPKCGNLSDVVYPEFVKDTLESAQFNISHYGMFVKMWSFLNIGDWYYHWAFLFLDYACTRLKVDKWHFLSQTFSKDKADRLTSQFLKRYQFEKEPYWKHGLAPYLSLLLQTNNT